MSAWSNSCAAESSSNQVSAISNTAGGSKIKQTMAQTLKSGAAPLEAQRCQEVSCHFLQNADASAYETAQSWDEV
jgi:hypothetical protein